MSHDIIGSFEGAARIFPDFRILLLFKESFGKPSIRLGHVYNVCPLRILETIDRKGFSGSMNLHSSHPQDIHHLDRRGQVSLVRWNQERIRRFAAGHRFFVNPVKITQPVFPEPGRIGQDRLDRRIVIVHDVSQCPFPAFPGQGHFYRRFLHRTGQLIEFQGDRSGQPYAGDFGQNPYPPVIVVVGAGRCPGIEYGAVHHSSFSFSC